MTKSVCLFVFHQISPTTREMLVILTLISMITAMISAITMITRLCAPMLVRLNFDCVYVLLRLAPSIKCKMVQSYHPLRFPQSPVLLHIISLCLCLHFVVFIINKQNLNSNSYISYLFVQAHSHIRKHVSSPNVFHWVCLRRLQVS